MSYYTEDADPEGPMTQAHKDHIRMAHDELVQNMTPERVLSILYTDFIITQEERDEISCHPTRQRKVTKLLETLPRRANKSFKALVDALDKSEQSHLANKLKDVAEKYPHGRTPWRVRSDPGQLDFPQQPHPVPGELMHSLSLQEQSQQQPYPARQQSLYQPVMQEQLQWSLGPQQQYSRPGLHHRGAAQPGNRIQQPMDDTPFPSIQCQQIRWNKFNSPCQAYFRKTDQMHYESVKSKLQQDKAYLTNKAAKGKACIVAIDSFIGHPDLEGYKVDKKNLRELWSNLGFEVYEPAVQLNRCLTALEIRSAVEGFAAMLKKEDQVAVLCILSHGKDRVILGYDGKEVPVMDLLKMLDNKHCPNMQNKPKLTIIQACQGGEPDTGVYTAAASPGVIPSIGDMLICYPTMPGYQSYVHPIRGSVYIESFVKVMRERAADTEIMELLTEVNNTVQKKTSAIWTLEGIQGVVMSPNFQSCLYKAFHLLPCDKDFKL